MSLPGTCEQCGVRARLHGHHDDYDKPYDLRWLCPTCHRRWHVVHGSAPGHRPLRSVRLTGDQLDRVREIATANHRTVAQELRFAVVRHIQVMDEQERRAA